MSQLSGARLSGAQFAKNLFFCPIFWGQKLKLKTQNKSCFTLGENLQRISRPKVQCDSRFVNLSHESPPSQWPDQFKGERKGHKSAKIILLSTQTRVSRKIVGVFIFKEKIQIILKREDTDKKYRFVYKGSYKYDTLPPLPYFSFCRRAVP